MTQWFTETLHPEVAQRLRIDEIAFQSRTGLQDLVIFDNARFGRVLTLDGVVQLTTFDEFVYHEMLVHVPLLAHGAARRVLIIGGGDGGSLRHALMHPVERVTMVEIDRSVVDLCVTHFPGVSNGAFDDPRTNLVIADGAAFVKRPQSRPEDRSSEDDYDVIIIDSTDPVGPGEVLFTPEFYADCKACLAPGGILVNQGGNPAVQPAELQHIVRGLRRSFADVAPYQAVVPTYYGGIMTLGWASDDPAKRTVPPETLRRRFDAAGLTPRYYTPDLHAASFVLPRWILDLIAAA